MAQFDYGAIGHKPHATRLRLNSTVVGVRGTNDDAVVVECVADGRPRSVTASHSVLAWYHNSIPLLCPEMSEAKKDGLSYGPRCPFAYANVPLKDG